MQVSWERIFNVLFKCDASAEIKANREFHLKMFNIDYSHLNFTITQWVYFTANFGPKSIECNPKDNWFNWKQKKTLLFRSALWVFDCITSNYSIDFFQLFGFSLSFVFCKLQFYSNERLLIKFHKPIDWYKTFEYIHQVYLGSLTRLSEDKVASKNQFDRIEISNYFLHRNFFRPQKAFIFNILEQNR